jgi:hypothetical protein
MASVRLAEPVLAKIRLMWVLTVWALTKRVSAIRGLLDHTGPEGQFGAVGLPVGTGHPHLLTETESTHQPVDGGVEIFVGKVGGDLGEGFGRVLHHRGPATRCPVRMRPPWPSRRKANGR